MAQLNEHPTGDQEVARSIPAGLETVFPGDCMVMKYFLWSFSPFH